MMPTFHISPYPFTFIASFICSFFIVFVLLRKKGIPGNYVGYSIFLNLLLILGGAKIYTVITSGFQQNLLNSGISSLGGVIGLFAGTIIFGFIYREGRTLFLQTYSLVIPLMYGIAKTGCYLMGCCHGIPYEGPLAVSYDNQVVQGGPYFPVQLAETVTFTLIFLVCLGIYFSRYSCHVVSAVMILCAIGKFSLEYLREEHIGKFLSANQWVCIGFVLWGILLIYHTQSRPANKEALQD